MAASPPPLAALWAPWFLGPLAWALQLWLAYLLASDHCEHGGQAALYGVSVLALAIDAAGIWLGTRNVRAARAAPAQSRGPAGPGLEFMARVGLRVSLLFLALVVAETIPMTILACG